LISPFLKSLPVPGFTGEGHFGGCKLRAVAFPVLDGEDDSTQDILVSLRTLFGGPPKPDESGTGDLSRRDVDETFSKAKEKGGSEELEKLLSIPFSHYPSKEKMGFGVKYFFIQQKKVAEMMRHIVPLVLQIILNRMNDEPLAIETYHDILVEEVNFPILTGQLAQWIEDHFTGDEPIDDDDSIDTIDDHEEETRFADYDINPRRSLPDDVWLKSILQIKEFAVRLPDQ
jgi:hypothetical protein